MRRALAAAIAIAIAIAAATVAALTTLAVLAASPAAAKAPAQVKTAHVDFETCPLNTTLMKATLLGTTFAANQPILVGITVRNESNHACGDAAQGRSPLSSLGIAIGPCGNVSLIVVNAQRQNVYPGPGNAPSCALRFSVRLRAHHSLSTVGVWNQQLSLNGQMRVPAGIYRIIIDSKITFTVTLTGPAGPLTPGTPKTTPPPPGPCGSFFNLIAATPTTTTQPAPTGPRCPIGQVAPPNPGNTPTPTVPPSTTTTTTPTTNSLNTNAAAAALIPPTGTNPPSR